MLVDKAEENNRVPSLYARKQASDLPTWIVLDKQVSPYNLQFTSYVHSLTTGLNVHNAR